MMELFIEYSKDRQIIISTHSSHFIDWWCICNGSKLIRVVKIDNNTICHEISDESRSKMKCTFNNFYNPHILGMEATEALFTEDSLILVEGQEDVVMYNKMLKELDLKISGDFMGWGVGGA